VEGTLLVLSDAAEPEPDETGRPAGEVYDWYQRGLSLLASGNPAAAATVLEYAVASEPGSASLREALARALFDAGRYEAAAGEFGALVEQVPQDDYARFGLGLTRFRLGEVEAAAQHLAMAVTMRPGRREYEQALREARATLRAREPASQEEPTGDAEGKGDRETGRAPDGPGRADGSAGGAR
jgi:tetratricopeptide (TPR) repeat protein